MAQSTIYGFPLSTYVRSVRMTCEEKGVSYELVPHQPKSPEMFALSPTGTVPAFDHGDFRLYESGAIARYIDAAFDGPALQPSDISDRALMDQCLFEIGDTIYRTAVREIILPRFGFVEQNDDVLRAAGETLVKQVARLDDNLKSSQYLIGDNLTLADLFLVPIVFYLERTPEGQAAFSSRDAFGRWFASMQQRESYQNTDPPLPD